MPAKKKLNEKEAIDHLKSIYKQFLKEGGDPKRFTIRHYNRINTNSKMYIDVYVKKLGGWNNSLQKASIPLGFRQFKEFTDDQIANHVKKVYKLYLADKSQSFKYKGQEKTFRMVDFQRLNQKTDNPISLAVILKRFGSWSKLLKQLNIPIGRSRGLNKNEIKGHMKTVYDLFVKKEKNANDKVFSKEMYEKYNFVENVYISSKLIERRFGTWLRAKRELKIY